LSEFIFLDLDDNLVCVAVDEHAVAWSVAGGWLSHCVCCMRLVGGFLQLCGHW